MQKWILTTVSIIVVIFALFFWSVRATNPNDPIDGIGCLQGHTGGIALHIHPTLTIVENGVEKQLPANIGVTQNCMRWTHTHKPGNTLHIETPTVMDTKLGQFLSVWKAHSGSHYLEGKTVESVTVDGEEYTGNYEDIVFKDGQKIVITIGTPANN